jgi:hypothetical protein
MTIIERLREVSSWNDFARDLLRQYDNGKALTVGQVKAANDMFARMDAKAAAKGAATAAAAATDLTTIGTMFAAATASGLKRPTFRFDGLALSLAKATSANAGAVYVKRGGEYVGKVNGGRYLPIAGISAAEAAAIAGALAEVGADPFAAAVKEGRRFGHCACCGRLLVNDTIPDADGLTSVQRGIGPVCARHWGLM